MEIPQNTQMRVPVRLVNAAGEALTGKVFGDATVYLIKQGGGIAQKVLVGGDFPEISAGNAAGHYDLLLSASDTDTLGFLRYLVSVAGAVTYPGLLVVVAKLESDTYAAVAALPAAATNAQVVAAVADLPTNAELAAAIAPLALEATVAPLPAAVAAIPTNPALDTDYTAARAAKLDHLDIDVSAGGAARRVP